MSTRNVVLFEQIKQATSLKDALSFTMHKVLAVFYGTSAKALAFAAQTQQLISLFLD